ncbi:MAG: hypothetical protein GAK37_03768 [Pseudomonas sp.]|nr:MAG: hypothetical protein GAK37_03768 [Pseudomonas sp.]
MRSYLANVDTQRFFVAGRRFRTFFGRLRDQQVINVGGLVVVDHEARIGLQQVDLGDRQAVTVLVVQAFDDQALPFHEIARLEGIEGVQLIDLRLAGYLQGQRLGTFEVHVQVAAQHAAAQFQADERADIGLRHTQVDVLGVHFQLGADRAQVHLSARLYLALLAQAGVHLEGEGALVEAVEVLQVDVQRAQFQCDCRFDLAIGQVHLVVTQLHVLEQHLPGLARFGRGGGRLGGRGRFGRLAGEEFLPVELAVGFAGGPGFELVAADLADDHLLLGQVYLGVADIQAFQARQLPAVRGLDRKRRHAYREVGQVQLGVLGQVQRVVGTEVHHPVVEHQRHGVPHIGPPEFHFAVGDLECALRGDRAKAEVAAPVDLPAFGAGGHQGQVGVVVRQGAEVFQLEIQFVVKKFDGLAGAQVFKVHVATGQLDAVDTQRERFALGLGRCRFAGWQLEQLRQVELAGLVEQDQGLGGGPVARRSGAGRESTGCRLAGWHTGVQSPLAPCPVRRSSGPIT